MISRCEGGGIGRHAGLRDLWRKSCVGSSPISRTNDKIEINIKIFDGLKTPFEYITSIVARGKAILIVIQEKGGRKVANNNTGRNQIEVPQARKAMEQFKLEVANELGITNYDTVDKGNLTARQNGYVGGNMVKKIIQTIEEQNFR